MDKSTIGMPARDEPFNPFWVHPDAAAVRDIEMQGIALRHPQHHELVKDCIHCDMKKRKRSRT